MSSVEVRSALTISDLRSRILRIPANIRSAIGSAPSLRVRVPSTGYDAELTRSRTNGDWLGGVTPLFRQAGLLRDGSAGPEGRTATLTWSYDAASRCALVEFAVDGDWEPVARRNSDTLDPIALALEGVSEQQLAIRAQAIDEARALIEAKLGALDERDVRRLFELFNTDYYKGAVRANRFSPAFSGSLAIKMLARLPVLNRWVERIWRANGDEAAARTLEDLWAGEDLPGAGRSFPTMILHVRDPNRYTPLMSGLGNGFTKLTGRSVAGRKGRNYLEYVDGVREMIQRHGIPPHAVDVVLSFAARGVTAEPATEQVSEHQPEGFAGFPIGAFAFLRELNENNNGDWFEVNRQRFEKQIREPMRALIEELGRLFVQEVDPELEHEPKSPQTLASIRKNAYGHVENPYWPHYWAAIHRRGHKKSEDLQLYIFLDRNGVRWGLNTGSAPDAVKNQLTVRLRQETPTARRALGEALAQGIKIAQNGFELSIEAPPSVQAPSELADLVAGGVVLFKGLSAEAAAARGGDLAQDIASTFRVLHPLWLLATAEHAEVLSRYWEDEPAEEEDGVQAIQTREWLLEETAMDEEDLREIEALLVDKPQIIFYGPPGTGKTWLAERIARCYAAEGAIELIQFHASYGYEDFIEGLRPVVDPNTGQLRYDVVPGVFRQLCERARLRPRDKFVLIIDEINRGNLPRIFGELLYLLDRRGPRHRVTLALSRDTFSVPENLILIGTMNTADQSIALLDSALRRRFQFVRLDPDPGLLERWLRCNACQIRDVPGLLVRLNQELRNAGVDRNLLVGHSHFMRPNLDDETLRRVWEHSVVPSLEDHFYNQLERLDRFSYEEFVEPEIEELLAGDGGA